MSTKTGPAESVVITGAGGYIGRKVVAALSRDRQSVKTIVAADVRAPADKDKLPGVEYVTADIRTPEFRELLKKYSADVVAHLAAVVTPGRKSDREFEYSVDVLGTRNVIAGCLEAGVRRLIYTSSGAAYGYYADNPEWLDEQDTLRGNVEFAYSDHKRQVEEMLATCRQEHPELEQLIFRPGTVLGRTTSNQITALFEKWYVLGLRSAPTPFVFIWDEDVVGAIIKGIHDNKSGIYNMAGDGVLTMKEIATIMGKPYIPIPICVITPALWLLKRLGLTQYGPEQVNFLRYRPVLSNRRLKGEFGYTPRKTTREVFDYYLEARQSGRR
ncbi:MAG: SDR family oxidoreductase [Desulfomonile tiedjei]|nr:SDR family oxidoreductase [Desulfomonile tiedjei]